MRRSRVLILVVWSAILQPIAAQQAVESFRISTSARADGHQETLQAVDAGSKQSVEVFPGAYVSPVGDALTRRLGSLLERVNEADRVALVAIKLADGFDRSIIRWRAQPAGRAVALAVRYYRERLWQMQLEVTDDYGRADPVDPARYEFVTVVLCTRADGAWKCREEPLVEAAARFNLQLPQERAGRMAAAETLVDLVLAEK